MDGISFNQTLLDVCLTADQALTLPYCARDWVAFSIEGNTSNADPVEYAQWRQAPSDSTETVSILDHVLFHYLAIALLLLWAITLWYSRRHAGGKVTRVHTVIAAIFLATCCNDFDTGFEALDTGTLLLSWWPDAVVMLAILSCTFHAPITISVTLYAAYATWIAFLVRNPWGVLSSLPEYEWFFANLRPFDPTNPDHKGHGPENKCLICWSNIPRLCLPCRGSHIFCAGCLTTLRADDE